MMRRWKIESSYSFGKSNSGSRFNSTLQDAKDVKYFSSYRADDIFLNDRWWWFHDDSKYFPKQIVENSFMVNFGITDDQSDKHHLTDENTNRDREEKQEIHEVSISHDETYWFTQQARYQLGHDG